MKENLELLGKKVKDVVTGFAGTVTCISFDLYGCIQAIVMPEVGKDGKQGDGHWFDVKRLSVTDKKRAMPLPTFEVVPGPEAKPAFQSNPTR